MRSWTPRLAGAVLVAGLHLPVIVALLSMNLAGNTRPFALPPETMVVLPLVPRPAHLPVQGPVRGGAAGMTVPSDLKLPFAVPPAANAPSLGLGLFACAPENLKNLSREDRDKCLKLASGRYVAMKEGLPLYVKPPGPEWEGLRNSDLRARERNTADPCAIAKMGKMAGGECYHEVIYGKGLW